MEVIREALTPAPIRALVVDDEPDILRFLEKSLAQKGYAVQTTNHPLQALELLHQFRFDLLITDIRMPEMDGLTLLKKAKETSPSTKVILITGFASVDTAVGSLKLGAFDYLTKPFGLTEFLTVVKRAIQHMQETGDIVRYKNLEQIKEEFLRNVSHEMRTPLTCIITAIDILRNEFNAHVKPEEGVIMGKMITIVDRNSRRIHQIVEDLLDTFAFHKGSMVMKKIDFSVEQMVAECVEEFIAPCQERGLNLTGAVEPALPKVLADPLKLRQALMNLLGNAMKFTPAGGRIVIEAKGVREGNLPIVELSVKDTGVGISKENQEKIFEKFYQVDGSLTREKPGLGLGLALVKAVAEAHGGTVRLESAVGKGSSFTLRLPAIVPGFPTQDSPAAAQDFLLQMPQRI